MPLVTLTSDQTQYELNSQIEAGNRYSFRAAASNAVGEGQLSVILDVIAATEPAQALQPVKYSASVDAIEIRWQSAEDGGSPIINYIVEWDEGRENGVFYPLGESYGYETFTVSRSVSEYFSGGSAYIFRVQAVNIAGVSIFSEPSVSIIAAEIPSKPTQLRLVSRTKTKMVIAWH